jgi:ABC-type transporter lipoprotein component MlaA
MSGLDFINSSSGFLQQYNQLKGGAIDPYSSLKNGYTQYRRAAITE